jgi:hypothetical protein
VINFCSVPIASIVIPLPLVSRPAAAAAGDDATVTRARGTMSQATRGLEQRPASRPLRPRRPTAGTRLRHTRDSRRTRVQIPGDPIAGASTPEASPAAASPQATGVINGPLASRLRHLQSVRKRSRHPPVQRSVTICLLCRRETAARLTSILGQIIELRCVGYRRWLRACTEVPSGAVRGRSIARAACGQLGSCPRLWVHVRFLLNGIIEDIPGKSRRSGLA